MSDSVAINDPGAVGEKSSTAIVVLAVGGTGEATIGDDPGQVRGLLAGVTAALDDRFAARWVGYPASYGPAPQWSGVSYAASVAHGVARLRAAIDETTGPVMVIGYSQGAVVARNFVAQCGDDRRARIAAVGLVADPHQPPGAVAGCEGSGVGGPGMELPSGLPVRWVGAPEDMICNATGDSLVRDVADLTQQMALSRLLPWLQSMWKVLWSNGFQNSGRTSFSPRQWRRDVIRVVSAAREVRGYLPTKVRWRGIVIRNLRGGRHTSYAVEPYRRARVTEPQRTGCEELAQWMQVVATFDLGVVGAERSTMHAA